MQQEVRNAEQKADALQRIADVATSKVTSLELKVAQLMDQQLTLQLNERNGFDARLEKELLRLR